MQSREHGDDSSLSQGIDERTDRAVQEGPSACIADAIAVREQGPGIAIRDSRVPDVLPVHGAWPGTSRTMSGTRNVHGPSLARNAHASPPSIRPHNRAYPGK